MRYEFKGDGTNVGYTHYYPSGIEITDAGKSQTLRGKDRYNGKELQTQFGLNIYDYHARGFDGAVGRFWQIDPLAEKYPWISQYAYCNNNPIKYIDPDGRDWYWDSDGTRQFDPNVSSQKNLKDGQTYIGRTDAVKDKNGKVIENYRKDGSMVFSDQNSAYARMWSDANRDKKEVFGVISENSVTILPHYKNLEDKSYFQQYGYDFKDGNLQDPILNASKDIVATIHTHQSKGGFDSPSGTDANMFAQYTPYKPGLTMGGDGRVYGIYAYKDSNNKTVAEQIGTLQMYSIKNITTGRNDLRRYLKQVYKQIIRGR